MVQEESLVHGTARCLFLFHEFGDSIGRTPEFARE
jgi:hypothetical protein